MKINSEVAIRCFKEKKFLQCSATNWGLSIIVRIAARINKSNIIDGILIEISIFHGFQGSQLYQFLLESVHQDVIGKYSISHTCIEGIQLWAGDDASQQTGVHLLEILQFPHNSGVFPPRSPRTYSTFVLLLVYSLQFLLWISSLEIISYWILMVSLGYGICRIYQKRGYYNFRKHISSYFSRGFN